MNGKILHFPIERRLQQTAQSRGPARQTAPNLFPTRAPGRPSLAPQLSAPDRQTLLYYILIALPLLAALPLMFNYYFKH